MYHARIAQNIAQRFLLSGRHNTTKLKSHRSLTLDFFTSVTKIQKMTKSFVTLLKEKPRAGVYIDGSNIFCGGRDAGWQLDYSKLRQFIERKYSIAIMSYYNSTGYARDAKGHYLKDKDGNYIPDPNTVAFENFLKGKGVRVQAKPLKFIQGDESKPSNKMDGDLMIDAILEHSQWDELILFSGDCDFEKLVKQIASYSKKVSVFSFSTRLSHELKLLAFSSPYVTYTVLDGLKQVLKYDNLR